MGKEMADLSALEPDPCAAATSVKRFGQRKLSGKLTLLLGAMRVYVLIAVALVIYAFVHALMTPQ